MEDLKLDLKYKVMIHVGRPVGQVYEAVADPKLADTLIPLRLERKEVVYTNAIPMRWAPRTRESIGAPEQRGPIRRRGGA